MSKITDTTVSSINAVDATVSTSNAVATPVVATPVVATAAEEFSISVTMRGHIPQYTLTGASKLEGMPIPTINEILPALNIIYLWGKRTDREKISSTLIRRGFDPLGKGFKPQKVR